MEQRHPRSWKVKFAEAFRGILVGVKGQSSFRVHLLMACAVLVIGFLFRVSTTNWCILLLCISLVMSAELFNTSIETLSRAVDRNENPDIRDALDIAAGAVLTMAIGAAVVGLVVFLNAIL